MRSRSASPIRCTSNRSDGYVFSETDGFSTDGYALSSERIDLATDADWLPLSAALGSARAEVTSGSPRRRRPADR